MQRGVLFPEDTVSGHLYYLDRSL